MSAVVLMQTLRIKKVDVCYCGVADFDMDIPG